MDIQIEEFDVINLNEFSEELHILLSSVRSEDYKYIGSTCNFRIKFDYKDSRYIDGFGNTPFLGLYHIYNYWITTERGTGKYIIFCKTNNKLKLNITKKNDTLVVSSKNNLNPFNFNKYNDETYIFEELSKQKYNCCICQCVKDFQDNTEDIHNKCEHICRCSLENKTCWFKIKFKIIINLKLKTLEFYTAPDSHK